MPFHGLGLLLLRHQSPPLPCRGRRDRPGSRPAPPAACGLLLAWQQLLAGKAARQATPCNQVLQRQLLLLLQKQQQQQQRDPRQLRYSSSMWRGGERGPARPSETTPAPGPIRTCHSHRARKASRR